MDLYIWRQLNGPNTIRLLTLESGQHAQDLWGHLETASTQSFPTYEAISYVWESNETPRCLQTTEGAIPIQESAWRALSDLRFSDRPRTLWIDTVCVNQGDKKERAQQVLIMKDIFAFATTVLIYVGPETPYTVLGLWLLDRILHVVEKTGDETIRTWNEKDLLSLCLPLVTDVSWQALLSIADSPWFRRIWTTQEFVVSRTSHFIIGRIVLLPEFFLRALSIAGRIGILNTVACSVAADAKAFERGMGLSNYIVPLSDLWLSYQSSNSQKLGKLLRLHRHRQATDVRDKLFVMRNIASDGDDPSLLPDYDSPLADIFTRYATTILRTDPALTLLNEAGISNHRVASWSQHNTIPSWVPDWSDNVLIPLPPKPDPVCLNVLSYKHIEIDGRVMRVKARLLDKLKSSIPGRSSLRDIDLLAIDTPNTHFSLYKATQFDPALFQIMPTRFWWRTEKGHSAFCCSRAEAGDYVVMLFGAETLFVLRAEHGDSAGYHLVGNCSLDRLAQNWSFLDEETIIDLI